MKLMPHLQQNEKSKQSDMAKKKVWIHPEGERVPAAEYQHLSQKDMDYDGTTLGSKISNKDDLLDETCPAAKEAPSDERIPLTSDTFPQWLKQKKEQWHSERGKHRSYPVQHINALLPSSEYEVGARQDILLTKNALHEIKNVRLQFYWHSHW